MMRQLLAIAVGLIFLAVSAGSANAQTESTVNPWVISNLPRGVTVQSATPAQLAAAIAAIRGHPKEAKAIVSYGFSQFTAFDSGEAVAVTDAIISAVPQDEVGSHGVAFGRK